MDLRSAILHSKETGCEFWRESRPLERMRLGALLAEYESAPGVWRRVSWTTGDILATDWVCSDGWTPAEETHDH